MQRTIVKLHRYLLVALLLGPTVALADDAAQNSHAFPQTARSVGPSCMKTAQTQSELTTCAERWAQTSDKLLSKSYQAVISYLCPDERIQLASSEQAWIAFRDADCAFWGGGGGSIAPMNHAICRANLSGDRAKELDSWPPNSSRDSIVPCK
jgi:uncharacterized protein YecT (DUF1311 family)